MFSIFKRKPFFDAREQHEILESIRIAEHSTSGEIRLYIESRCRFVEPVERAKEVFFNLKMEKTQERNAVLVYMAFKDHQLAVFGDEGIYQRTGDAFWQGAVKNMISHFNRDNYVTGITTVIREIGEALRHHFPYNQQTDKNELPDDIVFGK